MSALDDFFNETAADEPDPSGSPAAQKSLSSTPLDTLRAAAEIAEEAPRSVRAEWDPINKMARAVELLAEISRWLEGKTRSDVIRAQESLKRILENSK